MYLDVIPTILILIILIIFLDIDLCLIENIYIDSISYIT